MNEASLAANLNPEIEAMQVAQRDRGKAPQVRDTVLQRAVDLVTAINFYKGRNSRWLSRAGFHKIRPRLRARKTISIPLVSRQFG